MTIHDKTVAGIVRRHPDRHLIANNHPDIEPAHFAAKLRVDLDRVIKFNLIDAARKSVDYLTIDLC